MTELRWMAMLVGAIVSGLATGAAARPDYGDLGGPCFRHVVEAGRAEGVDPGLIWAIVYVESRGNPRARSRAGAMGCGQLMPGTAGDLGVDPWDARANVHAVARYLRRLEGWLNGRVDPRFGWLPVVAAYHCGPVPVLRRGGRIGHAQTLAYVGRVRELYVGFTEYWRQQVRGDRD